MYQIMVKESELPWAELAMPGVSMKVLHKDEATGAMAVLTRIQPGASIPAHWHSKADETVFVLDGDFVEAGASYGQGSYFVGKARTAHGPHSTVRGCTVLTHFSAELDFRTGPILTDA
ncbi:MAG TPA: cupin domain-containing protein [Gemmataceae bacterium]|nr:cupin domain-containing protein [Gemmataceae bacterium]